MFKNEYTLNVDIKQKMSAVVPTFVQYDSATLLFKIFDGGKPFNLTGFTKAEVTHRKPDGQSVIGEAVIINGLPANSESLIRYIYQGNEMSKTGSVETSLTLFSGEKKVTIQPFKVNIISDLRDGTVGGANEEYGLLQELIADVNTLARDLENKGNYDSSMEYKKNNIVRYGGSSYQALQNTRGNAPPTLPINQNTWWTLLAQKGVDGNGAVSKVNNISPDINGNVIIPTGESLYVLADDFSGALDSARIQAAIDYADENSKKVVVVAERHHTLTNPIVIKKGVELRSGRKTEYAVAGNFRVFELQQGASITGGFVGIDANNFTSEVVYLDGKYQYEDSFIKTTVKDMVMVNWSGTNGGSAISLHSGGNHHHIQYVNFENLSISRFSKGIHLSASKPASGMAWVNANRFDKITLEGCTEMIVIDSDIRPPNECSGNVFTNLQIQPSEKTMKILTATGGNNQFQGMTWDLHFIPHSNPVVEFGLKSENNEVDLKIPASRLINKGDGSNSGGSGDKGFHAREILGTGDWNLITQMGLYKILNPNDFTESLNQPVGAYTYGGLNVFENSGFVTQWYTPHHGESVYIRAKFGSDDWNDWFQLRASSGGGESPVASDGLVARDLDFTGLDWNTITKMGAYRVARPEGFTKVLNHPVSAYSYGGLTVIESGNAVTQWYVPHETNWELEDEMGIHVRSKFGSDNWNNWIKLGSASSGTGDVPDIPDVEREAWNNGMLIRALSSTTDWNTVVQMGVYRINNPVDYFVAGLNHPIGAYSYGTLTVFQGSDGATAQWYVPHAEELTEGTRAVRIRSKFGSNDWSSWTSMETSTGSQAKASKALADANAYTDSKVPAFLSIEARTSDPASPAVGRVWLRTDLL